MARIIPTFKPKKDGSWERPGLILPAIRFVLTRERTYVALIMIT